MRFTAIWISLALSATTASAQPKLEGDNERVGVAPQKSKPRPDTGWIELASPTPVKHGTEFILVGKGARRLSQLRVEATGRVVVVRIRMFFDDDSAKTVSLYRTLDAKHASTLIDVPVGKTIKQIAVTTETHTRGTYSVHGSLGDNGIAKR